jgi:hypothetical protein
MCLLLGSTALLFGGGVATPAVSYEYQMTQRLNQQQLEYRVVRHHNTHRRFAWVRRWVWDNFWGDYHLAWVPGYTTYRTVSYTPYRHRTHQATMSDGAGENVSASKSTADDEKTAKADKGQIAKSDKENSAKPEKNMTTASVEPMARPQPPRADKDAKLASIDTHSETKQTAEKPAATATVNLTRPLTPAEIRSATPLAKVADPKQTLASTPIKSVWGDTLGMVRDIDMSGKSVKSVDAVLRDKGAVKIDASRLKFVKTRNLLITTLSKQDAAKLPKADAL